LPPCLPCRERRNKNLHLTCGNKRAKSVPVVKQEKNTISYNTFSYFSTQLHNLSRILRSKRLNGIVLSASAKRTKYGVRRGETTLFSHARFISTVQQ